MEIVSDVNCGKYLTCSRRRVGSVEIVERASLSYSLRSSKVDDLQICA